MSENAGSIATPHFRVPLAEAEGFSAYSLYKRSYIGVLSYYKLICAYLLLLGRVLPNNY